MTLLTQSTPRARKTHTCNWCGGDINVGETYERDTILDGNGFREWKSHTECSWFACEYVYCGDQDNGVNEDDFVDVVMEMANEKGFDTELDTYELVNLILEDENERKD